MKKKLSMILALALVFCMLFTGCANVSTLTGTMGEGDDPDATPTEQNDPEPVPEPDMTGVPDPDPTDAPEPTDASEPEKEPEKTTEGDGEGGSVDEPKPEHDILEDSASAPEPETTPDPDATPEPEPDGAAVPDNVVATVTIGGETNYYTGFGAAWAAANASEASAFVVVTLLDDVTAVDGKFGDYGALTTVDRTSWIVLDLNGHTLSRGLTDATENGEVFRLENAGYLTIKNGTVTGGNSTGSGGGIRIDTDHLELHLSNLTISGNHSSDCGGGMCIEGCNADIYMTNVTVEDNSCTGNGAGGIHWCNSDGKMANMTLGGRVAVYGNSASNCCDDLMAMSYPSGSCKLAFDDLYTDSRIGFAFEYNAEGTIAESLGDEAESLAGCFVSEAGSRYIIALGENLYFSSLSSIAATVTYQGTTTPYATCEEAWNAANESTDEAVSVTLYTDWVAADGSFGSGTYFKDGALRPAPRSNWLCLYLNNHTIDRGLYSGAGDDTEAEKNGSVLILDRDGVMVYIYGGTLTGGNTKGNGGAIDCNSKNSNLQLKKVTIKNNRAEGNGGGIYFLSGDKRYEGKTAPDVNSYLQVIDTSITNNIALKNGGGIDLDCKDTNWYWVYCYLEGDVTVKNNTGANSAHNIYIESSLVCLPKTKLSGSGDQQIGISKSTDTSWCRGKGGTVYDPYEDKWASFRGYDLPYYYYAVLTLAVEANVFFSDDGSPCYVKNGYLVRGWKW